nr:reverse transcriptase domain-containing protein [Tanacetum cinerariifolium]
MSTHSSARNLFPPLDNPEHTIRRRTRVDPTLLNDFEMSINGNGDDVPPPGGGDLPVPDLRIMEELCQPTLNGRGGGDLPVPDLRIMEELCQPTLNGRATIDQTQNVYAARANNQGGLGTLSSNTITNPKEYLKGITTRSGNAYKGPMIPTTSSPPKVVECETKVTKDTVPPTNNGSTKDVQPSVV